ncbi:MAG: hypothetical protein M0C28_17640 [Candidatus Moduliflexus flocculans]|nr:hypothetical protein [Candidatus Moduliflexus flocculans]
MGLNLTTAYVYDPGRQPRRPHRRRRAARRDTNHPLRLRRQQPPAAMPSMPPGAVTHTAATTPTATSSATTRLRHRHRPHRARPAPERGRAHRPATPRAPTDRITRSAYDRDNRLVYTVNALGHVTEARYDANGNVITRIAYATAIPEGHGQHPNGDRPGLEPHCRPGPRSREPHGLRRRQPRHLQPRCPEPGDRARL